MPEDRPYSFVVQSLYYRDEQIGFGVFELGPQQASLYQSLQGLFSSALKEIQLVEQMRQRAIQLQTAAEVSQASSSLLDPNQLIQQTVDLIRERFQLYYAGLFLVAKTGEWAVLQSGTGEAGQIMLARNHKLQVGGTSMIGWCIANQRARIALDVGQEAVRFGNPLLPETRSELALPLISRGQVIGALTIQSTLVRAFSAEDIATFQSMADQLANAIANARLFEHSQEALREVQTVQRRYLERAWTDYLAKSQVTAYETVRPGAKSLGDATLPEIEQAMKRQGATILTGDGEQGHSAIIVPLTMRGAAIGALGIHDESGARQWTEDEIALVESVAERMALAAENLRLLDDTQRRASREQLIGAITAHMRESLDVERVLQTAAREFGESLGAEVSIRLTPDDGQTVAKSQR